MIQTIIKDIFKESIDLKQQVLSNEETIALIETVSSLISTAFKNKGRLYFCGNGGSAADAQHLAAELSGRFYLNRTALPAEALHCNTSYLTAIANDYTFDVIYARLVEGLMQPEDVLIGLSTSGNSSNIINAFQAAKQKNITTIAFTGNTGGTLATLSDYIFKVPSNNTPRIQEVHMLIGHTICQIVESQCFE